LTPAQSKKVVKKQKISVKQDLYLGKNYGYFPVKNFEKIEIRRINVSENI